MDSHSNFDPHGFGRSAAINIFAGAAAISSSVRAALAQARAIADQRETETAIQQWHSTVLGLRDALIAQVDVNRALAQENERLRQENRASALTARILRAEMRALSALS